MRKTYQPTVEDNNNETQIVLKEVFDGISENYRSKNQYNDKIISGFKKLDELLLGFREGDLNIIASRPAVGKTTFALSIFLNIVLQKINALYISFEKYETDLFKNIISIKYEIDSSRLETGFINTDDFKNLLKASNEFSNNSMFLKTFFNADVFMLRDFIRERIKKDKIKIVFIDYLTLIVPALTYANRLDQISEISRSLKAMAMEFKIPFIVLCPIHRNLADNKPEITDLSESGSIEYEADRVIMLYKTPNKKKNNEGFDDKDKDKNLITVYVAKNKHGPTATFELSLDYKIKKIRGVKKVKTTGSDEPGRDLEELMPLFSESVEETGSHHSCLQS
jgi:replicative DNA helicase